MDGAKHDSRSVGERFSAIADGMGEVGMGVAVAVAVAAVYFGWHWSAVTAAKERRALEQVHAVADAVHNIYHGQGKYCVPCETDLRGDMSKALIDKGYLPRDMLGPDPLLPIVNAWGGVVEVKVLRNVGIPAFRIKFTHLPERSCVSLANEEFGQDLAQVDVNGIEQSQGSMLQVNARPACAKGKSNSIVAWTFY